MATASGRRTGRARRAVTALLVTAGLLVAGFPADGAQSQTAPDGPQVDAYTPGPADRTPVGVRADKVGQAPATRSDGREVVERRGANSRTLAQDDGSYRTDVFAGPVHFSDGAGQWQPIDNTLVPSSRPGAAFESSANSFVVSLPADLATAPVSLSTASAAVGFALEGAKGSPAAHANAATYADALPGVSAVYRASATGVKEELVLAGPTSPRTFRFHVSTSAGLTARENPGGGIDFVDGAGRVAMAFRPPEMHEQANEARASKAVRLRIAQASPLVVELAADPAWLAAPGRAWPVVVDPWLTIPEAQQDTFIRSGADANTNYGYDHALKVGNNGATTARSLLRFVTTDWVGEPHRVREAFLQLYMHAQDTGTQAMSVSAHAVNAAEFFTETEATWNNRRTATAWSTPGGGFTAAAESTNPAVGGGELGWESFDLTSLAQSWANGAANNGVVLKAANEGAAAVASFRSHDYGAVDASKQPYFSFYWDAILGTDDHYSYESRALSERRSASVNVASGNLVVSEADLSIRGTGLDLSVARQYNSRRNQEGGDWDLGTKWSMAPQTDYRGQVQRNGDFVLLGGREQFVRFAKQPNGSFVHPPGFEATLTQRADSRYEMTTHPDATKTVFESWGGLNSITDRNNNVLTPFWAQHGNGNWYVTGVTRHPGTLHLIHPPRHHGQGHGHDGPDRACRHLRLHRGQPHRLHRRQRQDHHLRLRRQRPT